MIQVTCEHCGAAFRARDEHAGKRGRCPRCGEAVQVPEPAAAPPTASPRAAAPRRARGRGRSGRRPRSPTRSRRPSSEAPAWVAPALVLVVVAAIVVGVVHFMGDDSYAQHLLSGIDALNAGRYEEALALFGQVPADNELYSEAQKRIAEARELMAAGQIRVQRKFADNLHAIIMKMKADHVDGPGPAAYNYAPNCRYLLKRAQEFLDSYPDDERAGQVRGLFSYYENVASLDRPPSYDDLRAEMSFRMGAHKWNHAMRAIDEFALASPGNAAQLPELREEVRLDALDFWRHYRRDRIEKVAMQPGQENWTTVRDRAKRFLADVSDVPGVGADAQALIDRALRELGG